MLGEQTRDRLWFLETLGELMVVIVWGLCSRWSVWHASLNPTKQLCGAGFPGYSQHAALHARIRKPDSLLQRWHQDAPLPVHSSCWGQNAAWWPLQRAQWEGCGASADSGTGAALQQWAAMGGVQEDHTGTGLQALLGAKGRPGPMNLRRN